jgi:tetratricopeptide (TPR) repeat protein/predicted Ser/Thr protein kinase
MKSIQPEGLAAGQQFLHYRILERVGAGGMGEVFRAEDTRLERIVALKFLQAALQSDPESRSRFLREARAASALRSPTIAAIYDIVEHEGSVFIAMEYVEGELLSARVARGPLPLGQALDIALQVADALDEAHDRGIVHRDIKSANLIITSRERVKVLDFGLAKFLDPPGSPAALRSITGTQETMAGMVLGTLSYMSPEQALARAVDHRSDLFSLGIVLYEMLTGRLPFAGATAAEIIDRLLNHDPPALGRDVPPELEGIVHRALAKDPRFRYQSAREFYVDLHGLQRRLDLSAPAIGASAAGRATSGRLLPAPEARLGKSIAVMTFSNITGNPVDDWIGSGIAETVTADLKNIQGLTVIGRAQVFEALKNLSGEVAAFNERLAIDIGRRLLATWIVGGGYQRMGDAIRITAHLLDVRTGVLLRTVKLDGALTDMFALQDRVVYELSSGLNLELADSEIAEIARDETQSVEAYERYSRGMMNLRLASRDALDRAIVLFEQALGHDPRYAAAWAALGAACDLKGSFLSMPELVQKAVVYLTRALELNPRLPLAHWRLGGAYVALGQYDEAITATREAIRLEPGDAGAHAGLARAYWIGKGMFEEAILELERAVALNPEGGYWYLQLAMLHGFLGQYDQAERYARHAIELQEQYLSGSEGLLIVGAHTRLGHLHYLRGRYDEAIREYEREMAFLSSSDHALKERSLIELNQKLGAAHLRKGSAADAQRYLGRALKMYEDRLSGGTDDPYTKYYIAALYSLRGQVEEACAALQQSMGMLRALNTRRAQIDPDFDPIREDPRFQRVVQA